MADHPDDGPVYEDAKDPRAVYEPIKPTLPPAGAPNFSHLVDPQLRLTLALARQ
jgi:hypothetical protein